eukprot:scaffold869_cov105-Isochrysis_galbana.AAC.27
MFASLATRAGAEAATGHPVWGVGARHSPHAHVDQRWPAIACHVETSRVGNHDATRRNGRRHEAPIPRISQVRLRTRVKAREERATEREGCIDLRRSGGWAVRGWHGRCVKTMMAA